MRKQKTARDLFAIVIIRVDKLTVKHVINRFKNPIIKKFNLIVKF